MSIQQEMMYPFRFETLNKVIYLTQQQLDRIPYLSNIVVRKDNVLSIQNGNDEYVLNSQINYNWFMVILNMIDSEKPSVLFTELSEKVNVLDVLELYDYLCIDPLPIPLLKDEYLAETNSMNIQDEDEHIEYRRANILEARDTAVQFIIALTKNKYNLEDFETVERIFSLVMIILSNPNVFDRRICHHTLTVIKKGFFSLFSLKQQSQLYNTQQFVQFNETNFDNDQSLPENFQNTFAWKGIYVSTKRKDTNIELFNYELELMDYGINDSWNFLDDIYSSFENEHVFLPSRDKPFMLYEIHCSRLPLFTDLIQDFQPHVKSDYFKNRKKLDQWFDNCVSIDQHNLCHLAPATQKRILSLLKNFHNKKFCMYEIEQEQKKEEAQSARSGRFNTLPKRPKVDKFKHRFGPKVQKYR